MTVPEARDLSVRRTLADEPGWVGRFADVLEAFDLLRWLLRIIGRAVVPEGDMGKRAAAHSPAAVTP